MSSSDFSTPRRMSPCALVITFLKAFKSVIGYIIIVLLVKLWGDYSNDDPSGLLMRLLVVLGISFGVALIAAAVSYFPKKFHIADGNLIFSHGLLHRETTVIPLNRIHTLRTKRGIIYRALGMRGITFDTLASRTEEIELILSENDWQSLIHMIEQGENVASSPTATVPPPYNPGATLHFSNSSLLHDALCQNHLRGFAILLGLAAMVFDRILDIADNDIESIYNNTVPIFENMALSPLIIAVIVAIAYVVILALWLGKTYLRYSDMTLSYNRRLLTFIHGLLSRSSSRFTYSKICTIWVKRNFLEKRYGLATIMLKQALNASAEKDDENLRIYGADNSEFFLKWWLGDNYTHSPEIAHAHSGRGVMTRIVLIDFVVAAIVTVLLCHFGLYIWIALPALYMLFAIYKGWSVMCRSSITLHQDYIEIHQVTFADECNFLKYGNVEVVRIMATPITRWSGRVSLMLSTAGTTFVVRSLRRADAVLIYESITRDSASSTSCSVGS